MHVSGRRQYRTLPCQRVAGRSSASRAVERHEAGRPDRRGTMREIIAETGILATPEEVWAILADFSRYAAWNPFIRRIEGELREGARLAVELKPPGGTRRLFRPTLITVEPARELRWLGHLWRPGLFDGEHSFRIEPIGTGRVRLHQRAVFSGLWGPVLLPLVERSTRRGCEAMNQALKVQAQAAAAPEREAIPPTRGGPGGAQPPQSCPIHPLRGLMPGPAPAGR
jgi:hypothetical protein